MLIVENLEKSHQGRSVLKGISVRINPGKTVALAGSNGAGKSWALALLIDRADPRAWSAIAPADPGSPPQRNGFASDSAIFYT